MEETVTIKRETYDRLISDSLELRIIQEELEKSEKVIYLRWGVQLIFKDEALEIAGRTIERLRFELKQFNKHYSLPWYKRLFKKI